MMENQYDSGIILTLDFLTNYCGYYDFEADEYVCLHDNPPDRLDDGRGMCMAGGCPVANQVKETRNCEGDQPMEVFDPIVLNKIQSSTPLPNSVYSDKQKNHSPTPRANLEEK